MAVNTFTFDGVCSSAYSLGLTAVTVFDTPSRSVEAISVPGRNGDLLLDNGKYENRTATYRISCKDMSKIDGFKQWMISRKGAYKRLTNTYDLYHYQMASFVGPINFDVTLLKNFAADLEFNCKPQRFLLTGETPLLYTQSGSITNPTLYNAQPSLTVIGTGTFSINGFTITVSVNESSTVIDCETGDAYNGVQNLNGNVVMGDPYIQPGINTIVLPKGMSVSVTPRWWEI